MKKESSSPDTIFGGDSSSSSSPPQKANPPRKMVDHLETLLERMRLESSSSPKPTALHPDPTVVRPSAFRPWATQREVEVKNEAPLIRDLIDEIKSQKLAAAKVAAEARKEVEGSYAPFMRNFIDAMVFKKLITMKVAVLSDDDTTNVDHATQGAMDASAFDEWVVDRLDTGYFIVNYALFFIQNQHCGRKVTLWHIVRSPLWIDLFVRLVMVLKKMHRGQVEPSQASEIATQIRELVATTRIDEPVVVWPSKRVDFKRMLRDATGWRDNNNDGWLDMTVESACWWGIGKCKPYLFQTKRHAMVQLVSFILFRRARHDSLSASARKQLDENYEQTRKWLDRFSWHGCSCPA